MPGSGPDLVTAREAETHAAMAMEQLLRIAPRPGSYNNESDYFQADWQTAFWGTNYQRLLAIKRRYDPLGLFLVHHGVGSEKWSADGFARAS